MHRPPSLPLPLLVALCAWLPACGQSEPADARPVVVASLPPLAGFAKVLLGDGVRVTALVPGGADPHVYEPSSSRLADVEHAALLIVVGHPSFAFEQSWLPALRQARPDLTVVAATDALPGDVDDDPHLWTAPADARAVVAHLAAAFGAHWPEQADAITERAAALDARLIAAGAALTEALHGREGVAFVTMHAAWGRLARAHGLVQLAFARSHGEPSPLELARLVDRARAADARLVLDPPWTDPRPAQLLAEALGAAVVSVDPLDEDWEHSLSSFTAALAGTAIPAPAAAAPANDGARR